MQINLSKVFSAAAAVADVFTGDSESIRISHAGLTVTVPYQGNENKTIREILSEYGREAGIPASARPAVRQAGVGTVPLDTPIEAGGQYEAFTDKKENA